MANLLETLTDRGSFTMLLNAIETAELTETLEKGDSLTILAVSDRGFSQLPDGLLSEWQQNLSKLRQVLLYHVLFGDVRSEDLAEIHEAPTMEGSILIVEHENGITVNDVRVTETDILADNGVIHVIDTALVPTMLIPE